MDGFVSTGKDEKKGAGRGKLRFRPIRHSETGGATDLAAGAGGVISSIQDLVCMTYTLKLSLLIYFPIQPPHPDDLASHPSSNGEIPHDR